MAGKVWAHKTLFAQPDEMTSSSISPVFFWGAYVWFGTSHPQFTNYTAIIRVLFGGQTEHTSKVSSRRHLAQPLCVLRLGLQTLYVPTVNSSNICRPKSVGQHHPQPRTNAHTHKQDMCVRMTVGRFEGSHRA